MEIYYYDGAFMDLSLAVDVNTDIILYVILCPAHFSACAVRINHYHQHTTGFMHFIDAHSMPLRFACSLKYHFYDISFIGQPLHQLHAVMIQHFIQYPVISFIFMSRKYCLFKHRSGTSFHFQIEKYYCFDASKHFIRLT